MKTIAASKLRRAQDRIVSARPFAQLMLRVLNSLATRVDPSLHPLLAPPSDTTSEAPTLLVVITADKGLCGSFNSMLLRQASAYIRDADHRGRTRAHRPEGAGLLRQAGVRRPLRGRQHLQRPAVHPRARGGADAAIEEFTTGSVANVYVLYNEFKSVLQQRVVVERLLPIPRLGADADDEATLADHLFEPTPVEIFDDLLPRHVETQVFRAMLESAAAEHAARMTAMDAATRNAGEMLDNLTLYMNKMRQATITRELIEVVSGAEAL